MSITLAIWAAAVVASGQGASPQTYPHLEGRVIFENDTTIVQHFLMGIGVTTGMHRHQCDQMEILLSSGKGEVVPYSPAGKELEHIPLDMERGDLRIIEPSDEQHNFVNVDNKPIEWLLVTTKATCRNTAGASESQQAPKASSGNQN